MPFISLKQIELGINYTDDLTQVLPMLPSSRQEVHLLDPELGEDPEALQAVKSFLARPSNPKIIVKARYDTFEGSDDNELKLWQDDLGVEFVDCRNEFRLFF